MSVFVKTSLSLYTQNTNDMKYWYKDKTERGYGPEGIILQGDEGGIVSVVKEGDNITITEECDGWFSGNFTEEEFFDIISELLNWVNSNEDRTRNK